MKHFLLALGACAFALHAAAQITIVQSDLPVAGQTFTLSNANPASITAAQLSSAGANQTWNFNLQYAGQTVDTMFHVSQTPLVYNLIFFTADYADNTTPDFSLAGQLTVQNIYNFYNLTSAKLEEVGFGATINGVSVPVPFSPHDLLYQLPVNFNDTWMSDAAFDLNIPTLGEWKETRDRSNTADAWGTLTLPIGSQQVLRVKSDVHYVDSIIVSFMGVNLPIGFPHEVIEYKWLGKNDGLPWLQVNTNVLVGTETVSQIMYRDTTHLTDVQSIADNQPMTLYPQPATDAVTVLNPFAKQGGSVSVTLTDMTGRAVMTESLPNALLLHVNTNGLSSGVYLMTLQASGKAFTRRLAVSR